jgi:excinuclease ABC subunit C
VSLKAQYDRFAPTLQKVPHKPGVYRYYDESGKLLYVGKAKDLKNRVSSYFQDSRVHNQRTYIMVNQIAKIEYTIVTTEKEALLLEANLIHALQPRFNILLKDEQNYLYVRFTYNDEIPGVFVERQKTSPKYTYYGPFFSRYKIQEILRVMRMVFPYCEKRVRDGKPCEYVALGQCDGICTGSESEEHYLLKLKQIEFIFNGKTDQAQEYLEQKMIDASANHNFELAGFWRDRVDLLKSMFERNFGEQKMVLPSPDTLDIITLVVETLSDGRSVGSVFVQSIRDGKMVNVNNFLLSGGEAEEEQELYQEYLERFLKSYYIFQKTEYPVVVQAYQKEP